MVKIPKNETELMMYKQAVIKEYKLKNPQKPLQVKADEFVNRLRLIVPINIIVACIASVLYIILSGWVAYAKVLLTSVIWITLVGTITSAILGKK
jgi:hypothetical protein